MPTENQRRLKRELGVYGAMMMGLGSIVGTGVFVSIGVAAGVAGPSVVLAITIAAFVAMCNALSSAQLAVRHPVSGGTYEYGYERLNPLLGFTAGWMFLCAKSASAATAALGFAGYVLLMIGRDDAVWHVPLAVITVVVMTLIVLSGIQRSNMTNIVIVSITVMALTVFVLAGLPTVLREGTANFTPFFRAGAEAEAADGMAGAAGAMHGLLAATALMFVAYTGYGRIATLGEEIREPERNIPRAIVLTLIVSAVLYVGVSIIAIGAVGAETFGGATADRAAPLVVVARLFDMPGVSWIVAIGAIVAMLGVLLNLVLGLSRVVLAMGRRGDLPQATARLNTSGTTPFVAVTLVGVVIASLALIGDVRVTWSFSAFTVLIYYAITNLAALQLKPDERLYSRAFAWCGLLACVFLAFWVQWHIWLIGLGVIALGLLWRAVMGGRWMTWAGP